MTKRYSIDMIRIEGVINHIKQKYIRNSIANTRRWTPCKILPGAPPSMAKAHTWNVDPESPDIVNRFGKTKISDYSIVELDQYRRFAFMENAMPLLKDKTISILRNCLLY
ncbi:hypothetical protein Q1695_007134 [Nippostrongylus brasiliensis]|nr:hypothetical protein Q1695_007134 [Nippostrongylus brasiliensis]